MSMRIEERKEVYQPNDKLFNEMNALLADRNSALQEQESVSRNGLAITTGTLSRPTSDRFYLVICSTGNKES